MTLNNIPKIKKIEVAVKDKISEVVDIVRTDWANPVWPIYD